MRRPLTCILVLALLGTARAELLSEKFAPLKAGQENYVFQLYGKREQDRAKADRLKITAPDGTTHELTNFESQLPDIPEMAEPIIEDVNFDGYADIRLLEYLPSGANVPYHYWLFDPSTKKFAAAPAYQVVISPEIDLENRQLLSRQRVSAAEYVTDFYRPEGDVPVLVRQEVRTFKPDGSSVLKIYVVSDDSGPRLVETRELPADAP